ncbi:MAG: AAA family ATPase [Candidatus Zixiibacteriota bacterium]
MMTDIQIEGFKSFGAPNPRLRLGPLNFLVGANASGKSNFIAALQFVQNAVVQNVDYAVNELGGTAEVRNKILRERELPKPVRFFLRSDTSWGFAVDNREWRTQWIEYEVSLNLRGDAPSPVVATESLVAQVENGGKAKRFELKRDASNVSIVNPTSGSGAKLELAIPEPEQNRLALGVGFYALPAVFLRKEIESWRFFNISPKVAREPYKELPDVGLGTSGENLAVVLHNIEKNPKALEAIVRGLRGAVPGFKSLKTVRLPVEGKYAFQVIEERIKAINPSSVSDGTIRLLSLLVVTQWMSEDSQLIAIEEPENGLHPHLSGYIVDILKAASLEKQLIVTTHNPEFLNSLSPDQVIMFEKKDGITQTKKASDIDQIGVFSKHFRLGELWEQGTLGGIL